MVGESSFEPRSSQRSELFFRARKVQWFRGFAGVARALLRARVRSTSSERYVRVGSALTYSARARNFRRPLVTHLAKGNEPHESLHHRLRRLRRNVRRLRRLLYRPVPLKSGPRAASERLPRDARQRGTFTGPLTRPWLFCRLARRLQGPAARGPEPPFRSAARRVGPNGLYSETWI